MIREGMEVILGKLPKNTFYAARARREEDGGILLHSAKNWTIRHDNFVLPFTITVLAGEGVLERRGLFFEREVI